MVLNCNKVSMKKLTALFDKAKKNKDESQIEVIETQMAQVQNWYDQYKSINMGEPQLRKELAKGGEAVQSLIDRTQTLFDLRTTIKLETTDNESKILNKVKKWSCLVKDCSTLLTLKTQTEVDFKQYKDIIETLKVHKALAAEVTVAGKILAQDEIVQQFEVDISALERDQPVDLDKYQSKIDEFKQAI